MQKVRKEIVFTGRVQGVGFRYRASYAARGLEITGWIKNEWDGSVVAQVQGYEAQIDRMLAMLNQSPYIRIDKMDVTDIPVHEQERGFRVMG